MSQLTICLIIFVLTIIGYCSGKYSLATFSIIALVAMTLTGCLEPDEALTYFSNSTIIMIGGMCVIAAGFNRTSFCTNVANRISRLAQGNLTRMMLGYVVIGVILSQFIQSPVTVIGIVAPMLAASADSLGYKPSKVIFAVGVATVVTCSTLPVGSGATVAAELNGYLESYGYTDYMVNLADPMKGRLPMMIMCIIYCAFLAPKFSSEEPVVSTGELRKAAQRDTLKMLPEYAGVIIFFLSAIALMFAQRIGLTAWQVTVTGALAMIVFGVLKPKEACQSLPISMLLLIAGSLSISGALSTTGAGEAIGREIARVVAAVGGNSYIVGFIFFIVPFLLTQVMNNRGTMLIFMPIAISTCSAIGANPVGLMIIIQAACLAAFMTPMATSAIPVIMSYGGYDQRSMIKQSWLLALVCCVVSVGWIMTVFPL